MKLSNQVVEAIFDSEQFKDQCTREDDVAVFSSGYGSGPITINVRDIARVMIEIWTSGSRAVG